MVVEAWNMEGQKITFPGSGKQKWEISKHKEPHLLHLSECPTILPPFGGRWSETSPHLDFHVRVGQTDSLDLSRKAPLTSKRGVGREEKGLSKSSPWSSSTAPIWGIILGLLLMGSSKDKVWAANKIECTTQRGVTSHRNVLRSLYATREKSLLHLCFQEPADQI